MSETTTRSKMVLFRTTPDEYAKYEQAAKDQGLSYSEWQRWVNQHAVKKLRGKWVTNPQITDP